MSKPYEKAKEVYKNALEMFNGCCAICGNNYPQLHHIRYGGFRGGRKTYRGNVIPLCIKHHDLVHSNKEYYMPKLIKLIDERIKEYDNRGY